MTQSYRDNNTRSSNNNQAKNPGNRNNRNNGGNNRSPQAKSAGNNTLLDDEYWKGRNRGNNPRTQIHWKPVLTVLATVFVVGALVGGLAVSSASHKDAKTESVLICQQGGGLLGISCH